MKKIFLFLNVIFLNLCYSQDIHFSQFNNTPLMLNPALVGDFQGKGRYIVNYRNQWRSISKNSYKTYAFSADYSFLKEKFAAGLSLYKDLAGDGNMSTSEINLTVASKIRISKNNFFKLGIQASLSQKRIDINKLTWNSQFDGNIINTNMSSGEINYRESFNYLDFATGFLWTHRYKNKSKLNLGMSAFHVNQPLNKFLSDYEPINIRWCFHADFSFPLNTSHLILYPSLHVLKERFFNEINIGAIIKYKLGQTLVNSKETSLSYLLFGVYYRYNDAIIPYFKINYKNYLDICFTYDINVSKFVTASNLRGGLEISLIYIIPDNVKKR